MVDAPKLNEIDRERFSDAVEGSFAVVSRPQFFVWTQSSLQAMVPHEILICGIEDASKEGMTLHRFSASRYFGNTEFERIADPRAGLRPWLQAMAETHRCTQAFCPPVDGTASSVHVQGELQSLVEANELKNLAAQIVRGTRGEMTAFYAFSRVPSAFDRRLAYALELLVPHLHAAFLRVLACERDLNRSTPQQVGRVVTARQGEILELIKAGKTNAEIALMLNCSPWTIKNHVHSILRRLDSSSRSHAIARAMSLGILRPD